MTKTKTTKLLLAFLIFFTCTSYGQQKQHTNKKDTTKHWEVGLDLLWLIDKNQVPSTSLFGRYNFVDRKGKAKALRLRVGVLSKTTDSTQVNSVFLINTKESGILVRPGFEWQKGLTPKMKLFYGLDLSVSYAYSKDKRILYVPDPTLFEIEDNNWAFGGHGLLGFKYQLTNTISISSETTLNIYHQSNHRDILSGADPNFPNTGGVAKLDTRKTDINFTPITVINISFNF